MRPESTPPLAPAQSGRDEAAARAQPPSPEAPVGRRSDPLPIGRTEVAFVANSLIQFLEFRAVATALPPVPQRFVEAATTESEAPALFPLGAEAATHPVTGEPLAATDTITIAAVDALDAFVGEWLPVPFLRDTARPGAAPRPYGPTNWARLFIHRADVDGGAYQLLLAFDTEVAADRRRDGVAPSSEDVAQGTLFRFADAIDDVADFVSEPWVDDWLRAAAKVRGDSDAAGDETEAHGPHLLYLAHYLALLSALGAACRFPAVRLLRRPFALADSAPVELLIDLGTTRSFATLYEPGADDASLRPVPIRDFGEPWRVHAGPMPADTVFSRAAFGSEALSRVSGRSGAFAWPSLVRTGFEARRLAMRQPVDGRPTGLARPAERLWDERAHNQIWRFASESGPGNRRNPFVTGAALAWLAEDGEPAVAGKDRPATKARFSSSALTTLQLSELFLHALAAVDAPARTALHARPKALSRIRIVIPLRWHARERAIALRRAEAAVELTWAVLGWAGRPASEAPQRPAIDVAPDVASGALRAILHNEIAHRFDGQHQLYFDLMGTTRARYPSGPSLRVAAIAVGDRETTLSIATAASGASSAAVLTTDCIDSAPGGFRDAARAVAEQFVLPAVVDGLRRVGLAGAARFMERVLAARDDVEDPERAQLADRLWDEVLIAAAATLVAEQCAVAGGTAVGPAAWRLGALVPPACRALAARFDEWANGEGAVGFALLRTPIEATAADIAEAASRPLLAAIAAAARIVRAHDCDTLIVAGAAVRLAPIAAAIAAAGPVRADRIVDLATYRFGPWLPLRDAAGQIVDPKIAALAGATVPFETATAPSPLIVIGTLDAAGLLPKNRVGFASGELPARNGPREDTIAFTARVVIGARRLAAERWPATPLHVLDVADRALFRTLALPLAVTLGWDAPDGQNAWLAVRRVVDANGRSVSPSVVSLRFDPDAARNRAVVLRSRTGDTGAPA